jgi:hypothetical protein
MKQQLLMLALLAHLCAAAEPDDEKIWRPPQPITYDSLQAWYKEGGLPDKRWPRERRLDLNGDGKPEVFLGLEAYSRGMGYAVFTEGPQGWVLIAERVEGAKRPLQVLPDAKDGWHDFVAVLLTWRSPEFLEIRYGWDGQRYVRKSDREITSGELSSP